MIVDRENTVENIGGGFGRSQAMGIDTDSLAHLMSVLTNLYSDPETAVIREYSTNAYDSHVEAGKKGTPIKVTLPSVFDPVFKVKDQGIGLTADEVYEIYGMYGKSTKRHSNDFNGQLGLGCKSALTLSNQFSMVAVKSGVKNVFNIHLDDTGIPQISHAAEIATDEPNGVEVSIPVKNIHSFRTKAKRFYQFFPVMPEFNEKDFDVSPVSFDMTLHEGKYGFSSEVTDNYVVMGGVAYPFNWSEIGKYTYGVHKVVINAPMGAISFTPSREQLHYTNKTKAFLETSWDEIGEALGESVEAKLESMDTYVEALQFVHNSQISRLLSSFKVDLGELKYNDWSLDGINLTKPASFYDYNGTQFSSSGGVIIHPNMLRNTDNVLIVVGGAKDLNSSYKRKLKEWFVQEQNRYSKIVYFLDGAEDYVEDVDQLDGIDLITYDDTLSNIKVYNSSRSKPTKSSVFDKLQLAGYYSRSADFIKNTTPDATRTIVYANRKTLRSEYKDLNDYVRNVNGNVDFYVVNKRQQEAFSKVYPKAKHLKDFFKSEMANTLNNMTADEKLGFFRSNIHNVVSPSVTLNPAKIEDEDLKEFIETYNKLKDATGNKSLTYLMRICNSMGLSYSMDSLNKERDAFIGKLKSLGNKMSSRYPLLFNRYGSENAYLDYVNSLNKEQ